MTRVPRSEIRTVQGWRSLDVLSLLLAALLAAALFWLWPGRSDNGDATDTPAIGQGPEVIAQVDPPKTDDPSKTRKTPAETSSSDSTGSTPATAGATETDNEPAVSQSVASEPKVSEPEASEPVASEPTVSEPAASEPEVSEPATHETATRPLESTGESSKDAGTKVDAADAAKTETVASTVSESANDSTSADAAETATETPGSSNASQSAANSGSTPGKSPSDSASGPTIEAPDNVAESNTTTEENKGKVDGVDSETVTASDSTKPETEETGNAETETATATAPTDDSAPNSEPTLASNAQTTAADTKTTGEQQGTALTEQPSPQRESQQEPQQVAASQEPSSNRSEREKRYCRSLDRGAAVTVAFGASSARLTNRMKERLDELARCMKDRQAGHYVVGGHTDNQGNSIDNLLLSVDRARAATNYLVSKGVKPQRLEYRGFGDTQPIADNWTAAGRARNRRIEIRPR